MTIQSRFDVLICMHKGCTHEVPLPHGKSAPSFCFGCGRPQRWRFALKGELTRYDRTVLRRLRIVAPAPPESDP